MKDVDDVSVGDDSVLVNSEESRSVLPRVETKTNQVENDPGSVEYLEDTLPKGPERTCLALELNGGDWL